MQVILVKELEGLGKIGDAVKVKDGYARNFLLPRKIAIAATPGNLESIGKLKKQQEELEKRRVADVRDLAGRLEAMQVCIKAKVGQEDKLFGSVTSADIEEALRQQGLQVDKKKIVLEEPIKKLGEYTVAVKLFPEVCASLKVQVLKE